MQKVRSSLFLSILPIFLGVMTFLLVTATIDAPGLTWDEGNYIPSIISYLEWFRLSGEGIKEGNLTDVLSSETITSYWKGTHEHPPFALLWSGLFITMTNKLFGILAAARLSIAVLFALLVTLVHLFMKRYYNWQTGLFSALFLLISPRLFGHAHLATLDIPITFFWFATVCCFVRYTERRNTVVQCKWFILTIITFGLALLTKINAVFIPIPLLCWTLLYQESRKKGLILILFLLVFSPLFFFLWPWLWTEPLHRLYGYFASKLCRASIPVYYLGKQYLENSPPWHYPWLMTAVTIPPGVLITAITAIAINVKDFCRQRIGILLLVNIFTSLIIFSLPGVRPYDGIRLFLPLFPFIACLAGLGLSRGIDKLIQYLGSIISKEQKVTKWVALFVILFLASNAWQVIVIHPYYLSYYNSLVGGVKGAVRIGLETTYWGDTCNQIILDYLNREGEEGAKIIFFPSGTNVGSYYQVSGRLRQDFQLTGWGTSDEYDYLVLNCRQGFFDNRLWNIYEQVQPVFATTYQGIPLTAIYRK